MSDVAAISSAMAEYAHLVDDGQVEEWADLFLEEGELDVGGRVMHGRAAMVAYLRAEGSFGDTTHVVSAPNIRVTGDEAVAFADVLVVKHDGQVLGVARVQDKWVRCADRWRLRARRVIPKS